MRTTSKELSPLGERINNMRDGSQTLGQLAVSANMNYSSLYRIMYGESGFTRERLLAICVALDCNVSQSAQIFEVTDYRSPTAQELKIYKAVSA